MTWLGSLFRFRSYRSRLIFSFLLFLAVALLLSLFAIDAAILSAAKSRVQRDFEQAIGLFQENLAERQQTLKRELALTLADSVFRAELSSLSDYDEALEFGDAPSIDPVQRVNEVFRSARLPLFQRHEILLILDSGRRLIYNQSAPPGPTGDEIQLPVLARAAKEGEAVDLWSRGNASLVDFIPPGTEANYLVSCLPIVSAGRVLGYVIAGDSVSQVLPALERIASAKVLLSEGTAGSRFLQVLKSAGEMIITMQSPILDGETEIGSATLTRSLDAEILPFKKSLRQALAMIGIAVSLLSVFASILIASRLARPLQLLKRTVDQIRTGDLNAQARVDQQDEAGELALAINEMSAGLRQRDQIKFTFQKYLPPVIVEDLIKNPEKLQLGGRRDTISIVFMDLADFTSFSEKLPAEELISRLNEYFSAVSEPLVESGAALKYLGDGLMAFFAPPLCQANHEEKAAAAASAAFLRAGQVFSRWQALGMPSTACRIGIHTGEAIIGNVGGRYGNEYTVIGDAVNLASRLEGLNKFYGTDILASGETIKRLPRKPLCRPIDRVRVKGKEAPVSIYQVVPRLAETEATGPDALLYQEFTRGLRLYFKRKWGEGFDLFRHLASAYPHDRPTQIYLERCQKYNVSPPPADSDLVQNFTKK
jgi:adenylate cyclase